MEEYKIEHGMEYKILFFSTLEDVKRQTKVLAV